MKKLLRSEWWWVIVLLAISLWLRLYNLAETMPFTFDQGRDMRVLQFLLRGDLRLIGPTTGIQGIFLGPLFYYFLLPGFFLSQGSPMGVAIWNCVLLSLALPLFFYLLKPLVGKPLAWIGYSWLLFSAGSFQEARIIWNPSLAVPLLLISFWALFKSKLQPYWLILASFCYGLSLQSEVAYTAFLLPAYLAWIIWQVKFNRSKQKPGAKYSARILILSLMAFVMTLLPQALFEVRNNFIMTKSLMAEMKDETKTVSYSKIWRERPTQIVYALNNYAFGWSSTQPWLLLAAILIIIWSVKYRPHSPEYYFLLATFFLPLVLLMFFRGNNGNFFIYYLSPHYLILLASLLMAISALPKQKIWKWVISGSISIVLLAAFFHYLPVVFNAAGHGYTVQKEIAALTAVRQLKTVTEPGLLVFVPNLIPDQYQYLNEWLAQAHKLESIQFNQKTEKGEYFLIYEPAFAGGSQFEFDKWFKLYRENAKCDVKQQFGIVTVERCYPE